MATNQAPAQQAPRLGQLSGGASYREDRILIIPKAGRGNDLERLHGRARTKLRKKFPGLGSIEVIDLPPGASAQEMVNRYRQSGHVEAAGLDLWIEVSAISSDPQVLNGGQWHLNNVGQSAGVYDADIDAPEAWSILNSAENVIVAVIDSGLRQTHQDLAANLWTRPGEIPSNGIDDDRNGIIDDVHGINTVNDSGDPTDDYWHGTHVSGILGAVGNNGIGVSGVAWRVQIMPLKFLNDKGGGSLSDVVSCLDYARTNGARVINCSFVIPGSSLTGDNYRMLSNAFWSIRAAGIVVVAAAGNSGTDNDVIPYYPAGFGYDGMDNVIAVGATTRTDNLVYNYGATSVHLAAPGYDVLSTYNASDSSYLSQSGTSMATPCVAGAAALVMAKFPNLDYRKVISRILGTVDAVPGLSGRCVTGGRLNLAKALSGGFSIKPAVYSWVPTNGMTPLTLADDGVTPALQLPFSFRFGGQDYTRLYVGANGIVGFKNVILSATLNVDLPLSALPNSIICPFWDNLNPASGGRVWFGTTGTEPHRSVVISWVEVPHFITSGGQTKFTFQTILHESQEIAFQYATVQPGNPLYISGLSATIGVEDFTGAVAGKYSYNGNPNLVTNNQAILFTPDGNPVSAPIVVQLGGPKSGRLQLKVTAQPNGRCIIKVSEDFSCWTKLATNVIPASGVLDFTDMKVGNRPQRFYQAVIEP